MMFSMEVSKGFYYSFLPMTSRSAELKHIDVRSYGDTFNNTAFNANCNGD